MNFIVRHLARIGLEGIWGVGCRPGFPRSGIVPEGTLLPARRSTILGSWERWIEGVYRQVGITIMSKKEKQAIMSVQKMFEIKQRTDRLGLIRRKRTSPVCGAWCMGTSSCTPLFVWSK